MLCRGKQKKIPKVAIIISRGEGQLSIYSCLRDKELLQIYKETKILQIYKDTKILQIYKETKILQIYKETTILQIYKETTILQTYKETAILQIYKETKILKNSALPLLPWLFSYQKRTRNVCLTEKKIPDIPS